jgi:hypothetical protein
LKILSGICCQEVFLWYSPQFHFKAIFLFASDLSDADAGRRAVPRFLHQRPAQSFSGSDNRIMIRMIFSREDEVTSPHWKDGQDSGSERVSIRGMDIKRGESLMRKQVWDLFFDALHPFLGFRKFQE